VKALTLKWKKAAEKELNKIPKELINSITFKIETYQRIHFPSIS
jgi:hypothetical protein